MTDIRKTPLEKVEGIIQKTVAKNEENFQKWMDAKGLNREPDDSNLMSDHTQADIVDPKLSD